MTPQAREARSSIAHPTSYHAAVEIPRDKNRSTKHECTQNHSCYCMLQIRYAGYKQEGLSFATRSMRFLRPRTSRTKRTMGVQLMQVMRLSGLNEQISSDDRFKWFLFSILADGSGFCCPAHRHNNLPDEAISDCAEYH